jgi:hypothetical protein
VAHPKQRLHILEIEASMLANKRASGRPKDLVDVDELERRM